MMDTDLRLGGVAKQSICYLANRFASLEKSQRINQLRSRVPLARRGTPICHFFLWAQGGEAQGEEETSLSVPIVSDCKRCPKRLAALSNVSIGVKNARASRVAQPFIRLTELATK